MSFALPLVLFVVQTTAVPVEVSREAFLMGTRAALVAREPSRGEALGALERLLRTLEAAESDLSTWRDTPFNRLNSLPEEQRTAIDPTLCHLLGELDAWTRETAGAFDPGIGPLLEVWGIQSQARIPGPGDIERALPSARLSAWRFDAPTCTVIRPAGGRLDSGGFGKGEAIDRAARQTAGGDGWLVDLGGQVGVHGPPPPGGWRVGVAHPRHRTRALFEVTLATGSIATTGGSERDQKVRGVRVGHVIDPRSGKPAPFDGAVVVWHERALVADILSTALYVMGPADGLRWADARGVAACFLVPSGDGTAVGVRPSRAFRHRFNRIWEQPSPVGRTRRVRPRKPERLAPLPSLASSPASTGSAACSLRSRSGPPSARPSP